MHRQELKTMPGKEHPDTLRIAPQMHQTAVLRIGRVSVCYSQLPTEAYRAILMPTVISVSTWLPISSVLSACYYLERHCVLKSLVTSGYDRTISSASTTYAYTYLSAGRNTLLRESCHGIGLFARCEERWWRHGLPLLMQDSSGSHRPRKGIRGH